MPYQIMKKLTEHKKIILEIVLKWMEKEATIKTKSNWMIFKWGRKRFKIRRIY